MEEQKDLAPQVQAHTISETSPIEVKTEQKRSPWFYIFGVMTVLSSVFIALYSLPLLFAQNDTSGWAGFIGFSLLLLGGPTFLIGIIGILATKNKRQVDIIPVPNSDTDITSVGLNTAQDSRSNKRFYIVIGALFLLAVLNSISVMMQNPGEAYPQLIILWSIPYFVLASLVKSIGVLGIIPNSTYLAIQIFAIIGAFVTLFMSGIWRSNITKVGIRLRYLWLVGIVALILAPLGVALINEARFVEETTITQEQALSFVRDCKIDSINQAVNGMPVSINVAPLTDGTESGITYYDVTDGDYRELDRQLQRTLYVEQKCPDIKGPYEGYDATMSISLAEAEALI